MQIRLNNIVCVDVGMSGCVDGCGCVDGRCVGVYIEAASVLFSGLPSKHEILFPVPHMQRMGCLPSQTFAGRFATTQI